MNDQFIFRGQGGKNTRMLLVTLGFRASIKKDITLAKH